MKEQELENKVISGCVELTLPRNMKLEDFEHLYPATIEFQHVVNINLRNPEGRLERLDELARVGGREALHDMLYSSANKGLGDVVDHIIKNHQVPHEQFTNAMHQAASWGHIEVIETLLDHRVQINEATMATAASQGQLEVVKLLLDHGASRETAMKHAATAGQIEVVNLLLELGESPATGIGHAAKAGQIEVVETLLKAGASIDAAMERGSETTKDFCKAYRLREQLNQMSEKTQVSKKPTVRKI